MPCTHARNLSSIAVSAHFVAAGQSTRNSQHTAPPAPLRLPVTHGPTRRARSSRRDHPSAPSGPPGPRAYPLLAHGATHSRPRSPAISITLRSAQARAQRGARRRGRARTPDALARVHNTHHTCSVLSATVLRQDEHARPSPRRMPTHRPLGSAARLVHGLRPLCELRLQLRSELLLQLRVACLRVVDPRLEPLEHRRLVADDNLHLADELHRVGRRGDRD